MGGNHFTDHFIDTPFHRQIIHRQVHFTDSSFTEAHFTDKFFSKKHTNFNTNSTLILMTIKDAWRNYFWIDERYRQITYLTNHWRLTKLLTIDETPDDWLNPWRNLWWLRKPLSKPWQTNSATEQDSVVILKDMINLKLF